MSGIRVEILYFADAARRVGSRREVLSVKEGDRLADLQEELFRRHTALREIGSHLLWSINEEVADPETSLHGARRIGVLPPFSGG